MSHARNAMSKSRLVLITAVLKRATGFPDVDDNIRRIRNFDPKIHKTSFYRSTREVKC